MSIRLNRRKLLCISFFLCCVLPACFSWFSVDDTQWRGVSLLEMPLLASTCLFAFALLFERVRYMLPLGIFSHLLLTVSILLVFVNFPVAACRSAVRDLSMSMEATRPMFWIGFALPLFHLALFTTTEIAMQKLSKHTTSAQNKSE